MIDDSQFDRRTFLRRGAMGAGAVWAASFAPFLARRAEGAAIPSPYGPICPQADEVTGRCHAPGVLLLRPGRRWQAQGQVAGSTC